VSKFRSPPVAASGDSDLSVVDHLVYATTDIQSGIDEIERLTGIRAVTGGSHPGMGTQNALLSLGPGTYLEIIAPDPAQTEYRSPRLFQVDEIDAPRLVTWAAKGDDMDRLASLHFSDGSSLGEAMAGSRETPGGITLTWQLTNPYTEIASGVVPFIINWGDTPHPADNAPQGATLVALKVSHPNPEYVHGIFAAIGIDIPLAVGRRASIIATIDTPNGRIELQ